VLYEQTVFPGSVARSKVDVLLSTHNTKPLARRAPTVVVLQSLQYLYFPRAFGPLRRAYLRRVVPASLRSADAVIAVSEWARDQAIRVFGLDPDRVFAIRLGPADWARAALQRPVPARPAGERPYVATVSTLYEFKNHERLIRAFARAVREHGLPHELRLAGGDADVTAEELASVAAEERVRDRVRLLGPIPNDQIGELVAGADAVAYVSLFETFGQPVLEAFALGRCLVASNATAVPEVAGDAAYLVDPYDVDDIAEGLATVLLDDDLRTRLAAAGRKRAAEFTWEAAADGTARVLAAALADGGRT
jgi:glycosyltransferase involved in cell wall biosynthesis